MFIKINRARLEQLLIDSQMPRWWIAETLGVSKITVSRWVSGHTHAMKKTTATQLARLLNCQLDELCILENLDDVFSDEPAIDEAELLLLLEAAEAYKCLEVLRKLLCGYAQNQTLARNLTTVMKAIVKISQKNNDERAVREVKRIMENVGHEY